MKTLEKWMLINLTHPTIIGNLYGDKEKPDGYTIQLEVNDIDVKNSYLFSGKHVYKLGEVDKVWWKTKKSELRL